MTASMHHGVVDSVGTGTVNVNLFGTVVTAYTLDGVTFTEGMKATLIQDGRRLVAIGGIAPAAPPWSGPPVDIQSVQEMPGSIDIESTVEDESTETYASIGAWDPEAEYNSDNVGVVWTYLTDGEHPSGTAWEATVVARGSGTFARRNYTPGGEIVVDLGELTGEWRTFRYRGGSVEYEDGDILASTGAWDIAELSAVYET